MVFHPLLSPLHYLLQVLFHVLWSVAGELVDNLLFVSLHGFLVDGLEDLTLHIILQFFPHVASASHTGGVRERDTNYDLVIVHTYTLCKLQIFDNGLKID